jgi:hypothetical protein
MKEKRIALTHLLFIENSFEETFIASGNFMFVYLLGNSMSPDLYFLKARKTNAAATITPIKMKIYSVGKYTVGTETAVAEADADEVGAVTGAGVPKIFETGFALVTSTVTLSPTPNASTILSYSLNLLNSSHEIVFADEKIVIKYSDEYRGRKNSAEIMSAEYECDKT